MRPWEFEVPPITKAERRAMAFSLIDQLHVERERLGVSQRCAADMIDASQSVVCDGRLHSQINGLDIACGLAYVVKRKLVLVPWDDTSS